VREPYGGVEIVRAELPEEQRPPVRVSPALVLQDGYLLISSDLATLRACVDAKNGKSPSIAADPMLVRAKAALSERPGVFALLDWGRMLDQIAVYAPQMGGIVKREQVPFPEMPENGDAQEWQRRLAEYQEKMRASRETSAKAGAQEVMKWIDAARVIDFIAVESHVKNGVKEGTLVLKFTK
jgi:hypothetical protein